MTSHTKAPRATVAELIGETPEMLKLCGRILQLEFSRESMTDKTFRTEMRSLRHHMKVMRRIQGESILSPMMDNWTDEEVDVYLARYGHGVCDGAK